MLALTDQTVTGYVDFGAAVPNDEDDKSGWRRAFWLFQPHASINDGLRPADVFRKDPQAVIRAAHNTRHTE
jgi:hypothetical protein